MIKTLTGIWTGMFDYVGEVAPVAFRAQLYDANGQIAGLIEETEDMLDGMGPTFLTAVVEGSRRGEHVAFRKTYDDLDPIAASTTMASSTPKQPRLAENGCVLTTVLLVLLSCGGKVLTKRNWSRKQTSQNHC